MDAIKPLVERCLASLPALHRVEAAMDRGIRPPDGAVEREVVKGLEPRSQVAIVFTGSFQNDAAHRLLVKTMTQTLAGNLQQTLREAPLRAGHASSRRQVAATVGDGGTTCLASGFSRWRSG